MTDLSTTYLGMKLKNPIIASSSTLTDNVESIKNLEKHGIGAVVLRSIFEEEIALESEHVIRETVKNGYDDGLMDYFDEKVKQKNIEEYLDLLLELKREVNIPVIGSINCKSDHEWVYFAKKMEAVGVDALELNMFILPSGTERSCEENEKLYFNIVKKVLSEVNVPVTLKISHYFSNLASTVIKLSETGIKGLVLFNKFFAPDFDIEEEKVISTYVFSSPQDISMSLRWIAMLSAKAKCDLVASTGVHDGAGVIKQLLAGATAVQIASTLYKNGPEVIDSMLNNLETWMGKKGYKTLDDFRGKLNYGTLKDTELFERVQFMKHFGGQK